MTQKKPNDTAQRTIPSRTMSLRAATIDETARTVEAVVSTEAPVPMMDYESWSRIDEVLLADGAELPPSMPLLEVHARWSLSSILGSVRNLRVDRETTPASIVGTLTFADGPEESERAWNLVRQGHLTDVSVGYDVVEHTTIQPNQTGVIAGRSFTAGRRPLRVVTKWKAREGSLVPIGADELAKVREHTRQETVMTETNTGAAPEGTVATAVGAPASAPTQTADNSAARAADAAAARAAERNRIRAITEMAGPDTPAEMVRKAIDDDCTVEQAAHRFLVAERGTRPSPNRNEAPAGHVRDRDRDVTSDVLGAALILRAGLPITRLKVVGETAEIRKANQERLASRADAMRGISLIEICREAARIDGVDVAFGASRSEVVRAAISGSRAGTSSTGTLVGTFSQLVGAQALESYEAYPDSTVGWVRESDVPDFKPTDRVRGLAGGGLARLPRGHSAKHDDFSDATEQIRAYRFAKQFVIDEQDLIDDSIGILIDRPQEFAEAAAQLRPDLVYAILHANAALNVDSVALFHAASHANLATGGASALSSTSLAAGVTAMAKHTENGRNLNLMPAFLVVPQDLWYTATQLLASAQIITSEALSSGGQQIGSSNPLSGLGITPRMDNRLGVAGVTDPVTGTAYAGTATNWFLAARGGKHTIEVAYLAGSGRRPRIRPFVLDRGSYGIGWDVNHDIGAKALDYRGLYKSAGA